MKSSIKLKYGQKLKELMKNPILLSLLVQIAFYTDEDTGEAKIDLSEFKSDIGLLVIMGLIEHKDFKVFRLTNKKVIDITLKKKPTKSEINKQLLKTATIIPNELTEYYNIALAFWELFYKNLTSIGGRVVNLENANFEKWVTPIRLMIENDKVTKEQLREVFRFLERSEFWKDKVQSTAKLRVKFNTLYNQLKSDEQRINKKANGSNSGRDTKVSTEYVRRVLNDLQSE